MLKAQGLKSPIKLSKTNLDAKAIAILVMLCASWGLQQIAVKVANTGISPVLQGGLRSIGASLLLLIWMRWQKEAIFDRDDSLFWGIAAGLLFSFEFILVYLGLSYTPASRAVIFLYTSPFFVALGAQLFIPHEKISLWQLFGLICAFLGIITAFSEGFLGHVGRSVLLGDSLMLTAALLWGSTTVLIKASPLAKIRPSKTLLYQLLTSAISSLPLASVTLQEKGISH
ncbi:MAG: DMT family transporter [Deinococcales bacterium]